MASNVEIIVSATDQASGVLKGVGNSVNGLGLLGKAAAVGFAALAAGVAAAGAAMVYFVDAAQEAELVQAKFNALVGSSALAGYKSEMEALAQTLSQTTRFEDENILAAEAQLSLYENIGQDIFPQVIATSLDLAEALGVDAVQGAEMLGRGMADITNGSLAMLFRQKLITKEQQTMAEAMAAAGDEAGAQAYILGILDGKIGTLAETMGQTFTGQVTILKNNIGNLAEAIGDQLLPVLAPMVGKFAELVEKYAPQVENFFKTAIIPHVQNIVTGIGTFIDLLTGPHPFQVEKWLKDLDWATISQKIIEAIDGVEWNAIGQRIGHWIGVAFEVAKNIALETDWSGLFSSLSTALMDFATGLGGGNTEKFVATWRENSAQLEQIIKGMIGIVWSAILTAGSQMQQAGGIWIANLALGIAAGVTVVLSQIRRLNTLILAVLRVNIAAFKMIGKQMLEGIKQGIMSGWDAFASWLTAIVESIVQSVLDALGISSPSKVFANIGKQMMAGMAAGIGDGVTIPVRAMQAVIPSITGAALAGAQAGGQNHYYYGARIMLQEGREGQILASLTE